MHNFNAINNTKKKKTNISYTSNKRVIHLEAVEIVILIKMLIDTIN